MRKDFFIRRVIIYIIGARIGRRPKRAAVPYLRVRK